MSSSGSVKLRYEKCLKVWGNATFLKKWPEGVVTISALTDELMIIPSKIVAIFLVVIYCKFKRMKNAFDFK